MPMPLVRVAVLACLFAAAPASAGPVAEFETAVAGAYADYRMALVTTNQKNKEATLKAIVGFEAKWAAVAAAYGKAAPPHYVDDPQFAAVLARVADINQRAKRSTIDGKLAEAHEILEEIREELGHMRLRNGVMIFSDRMNTFHAHMEYVVAKTYDGFSTTGLMDLREDAAVLAFLGDDLKRHPPAGAPAAEFAPLLTTLIDAVDALQKAARSGDGVASKAAVGKLKPAYSRLFLRFG